MTLKWAWHVHHDVLVEPLTDPIETRREFIRQFKPAHEVATRLRLLKVVKGRLPPKLVEALKAYDEAWKAYDEARKAYYGAWKAYNETRKAYVEASKAAMPAIIKLHAKECPNCPWDGETIFPGKKRLFP